MINLLCVTSYVRSKSCILCHECFYEFIRLHISSIYMMVEGGGYYPHSQNHSTRMHLIIGMGESMKRSNSKAAQEAQAKYILLLN